MTNAEKYDKIFMEMFNLDADELSNLTYQSIEEWDSVGHMELITAIEDEFDIEMETDDIVDFSDYAKGKDILSAKYGIGF